MRALVVTIATALLAPACASDLDPPWQLDHTRIIAVRATPPAILPGEESVIDGLISRAGEPVLETGPETVLVVSPQSMASAVTTRDGRWVVQAPDEATLASVRGELALEPGAPIPLQLGVSYQGETLVGLKTVWIGMTAPNPAVPEAFVNGAAAPAGSELVIGTLVDVPLAVEVLETDEVNWLTSCGTMHDFDLPSAYIRVEEDDPTEGQLVVVLRDERGGVDWRSWPIRAE